MCQFKKMGLCGTKSLSDPEGDRRNKEIEESLQEERRRERAEQKFKLLLLGN